MYEITREDITYCDKLCALFHSRYGFRPDEDDIQDAREYFCRAAHNFDPKRGVKFITHGRWYIQYAVLNKYSKYGGKGGKYRRSNDVYKTNKLYYGLDMNLVCNSDMPELFRMSGAGSACMGRRRPFGGDKANA